MLTLIQQAEIHAPAPLGRADVLIADGRIAAIAPRIDARSLGSLVTRIDGRDHLLIPGLVDSLVHFSGGGGEGGFASRTEPLQAREAIAAGITTLVGALGTDDVTRSHADLLATARALSASGLTALALTGSYRVPVRTLTGSVRDDLVLIPDFIGVGEIAIADHRGSQPSPFELARIAAEARVGAMLAGKRGTVLVHVGDGSEGLALLDQACHAHEVQPSQFLPTHVNRHATLLDEGRGWLDRGGFVDLTTSTSAALIDAGEVPAADALAQLLSSRADPARIGMSSDGQASLPHFAADGRLLGSEVASVASLLAAAHAAVRDHGVSIATALATVTCNPAAFWGLSSKGRIAAGADADLVLLDRERWTPALVIAGGQVHRLHGDVEVIAAAA